MDQSKSSDKSKRGNSIDRKLGKTENKILEKKKVFFLNFGIH